MYWTPPWGASSQALGTGADKKGYITKFQNANQMLEEIPPETKPLTGFTLRL